MPDLEDLIRNTLDRQARRPDPDPIVEEVARRKRQVRLMRHVQSATLAVVVLAIVGAGGYALARAFGVGRHPAPAASVTIPGPAISPTPSGPSSTPTIASCGDAGASLALVSQQGAAGTIRTAWQVTNTGSGVCRSDGYPSLAIHAQGGWMPIATLHGGYADIQKGPLPVVLQPGQSMFVVTYWSDVATNVSPGVSCVSFDRIRFTLPSATSPVEVASVGCLSPGFVRIGPVTDARPIGA